jgi:hypothetical protein
MISDYYIPTPIEDLPAEDQLDACKYRMDEYIEQNYLQGGINSRTPNDHSKIKGRVDRLNYCRSLWNNDLDEKRYDYLYNNVNKTVTGQDGTDQTISMEMPAKVRHIPIVRPKLQSLISKEMGRPLITRTIGVSRDLVDKKTKTELDDLWKKSLEKLFQQQAAQRSQMMLVQQQQQLMQQVAEMPGAEAMIMEMQNEIEYLQEIINKDAALTQKEVKEVRKYYRYTHKEFEESLSDDALKEFIDRKRLRQKTNDAFKELMVTGEPIYYVDYEEGMKEPDFRVVSPEFIWYQYNETAKYLHELDWIVEYFPMSYGQLVQSYGMYLTKKQLSEIRQMAPFSSQDAFYRTNLDQSPTGFPLDPYSHNDRLSSHELDVYLVNWKEQTEVYALYTENKHESKFFDKKPPFVKYLTAKEVRKMTSTASKRKRMKRKGQEIRRAYRVDRYKGLRIGDKTDGVYFNVGKTTTYVRNEEDFSDVQLPYIGFANNRFHQAYSLLWETRDIQELYNILHYQEELLVALAGVRGIVYDLSQKPAGMSNQELIYYMKQGIMPIETLGRNGKPKTTTFNQFAQYDQTISPAVSTILGMKQNLNDLVGEITGVTRQQTGQVAATDQVGTTQLAIQQSNVVTEYYFQQHEELIEIALTRLSNLFPYAYAEGKQGLYVVGKERQEVLRILKDQLKGKFRVLVNSGAKEREIMQTIKQIATNKFATKEISATQLIDLLDTDMLSEMRKKLKDYEDEMLEKNQQMQQANAEQQKQIQMELSQMDMQMKAQLEQISGQVKMQIEQMKGQVQLQKEQMQLQQSAEKLAFEREKLAKESEIDLSKANIEADVEKQYLQFQYTQLQVNNATQRAQMLINRSQQALDIQKVRSKEKIKD